MTVVYFRVLQNEGSRGWCIIPCPVPDTFWKAAEQVQICAVLSRHAVPPRFWCLSLTDVSRSEFQKGDFLSISILSLPTSALPGQCSGLFCLLFWFLHFISLQSPSFSSPSQVLTVLRAAQRLGPSFSLQCWVFFSVLVRTGKSKNKNHRTSKQKKNPAF